MGIFRRKPQQEGNINSQHVNVTTFAEREGYAPPSPEMRLGELDEHFRQRLYMLVSRIFPEPPSPFSDTRRGRLTETEIFALSILQEFLFEIERRDMMEIIYMRQNAVFRLKTIILESEYYRPLTLIEHMIRHPECPPWFKDEIIHCFNSYGGPYHIAELEGIPHVLPSVSDEDQSAITYNLDTLTALDQTPALSHLKAAVKHIQERRFRESVRESISSVESVARNAVGPDEYYTLAQALSELHKEGVIPHENLYKAFKHLYDYTNSEEGIRHALTNSEESNVTLHEASLMFSISAALSSYLASKDAVSK